MDAYRQAILRTVRPGDVVLDIGTGSGILAFFACQAGAERVYAVDRAEVLLLAQQLAKDNGLAERITFFHEDFRTLQLPERVDVIVSELVSRGVLGQQQETLISLGRQLDLKPGGRLVPQSVDLWLAPVDVADAYARLELPPSSAYDLDFERLRSLSINGVSSTRLQPQDLLAEPQRAYRHDAAQVTRDTHADAKLTFEINAAGTLHGYGGWFEARLAEDVVVTNAPPNASPQAWDNLLLPIAEPVSVTPGMIVELRLRAYDRPRQRQFWQWDTIVHDVAAQVIARYQQSTFFGEPCSPELTRKRAMDHMPALDEAGEIDRLILSLMDGRHTLEAIVREVTERFPARFPRSEDALEQVAEMSGRHSR